MTSEPSVPDTVVDHRPPVAQKPLRASAVALLEFYYRLNVFVMATEERAACRPVPTSVKEKWRSPCQFPGPQAARRSRSPQT